MRATIPKLAALLVLALFALPDRAFAPVASITPQSGQQGQTAVIHGDGFKSGAPVVVKFGRVASPAAAVTSPNSVRAEIPARSSLDGPTVPVKVTIDGIDQGGGLTFDYRVPPPAPLISGFDPASAAAGSFAVVLSGSDFTTPAGRVPETLYLVGDPAPADYPGRIDGFGVDRISASFEGVTEAGSYKLVIGFSDRAGAERSGFVVLAH